MLRITFHSRTNTADLCGSERAYAGCLTHDLTLSQIDLANDHDEWQWKRIEPALPSDCYARRATASAERARMFATWWMSYHQPLAIPDRTLYTHQVSLNTALALGSDAVIWLTRMHATCEINGYVEGPDRAWLADIIERGLRNGVLRSTLREWGRWPGIIDLLREADDSPVVMEDSSGGSFLSMYDLLDYDEESDDDWEADLTARWDALGEDGQWDLAITQLREANIVNKVDLTPATFHTRRFGAEWNLFDVLNWAAGNQPATIDDAIGVPT